MVKKRKKARKKTFKHGAVILCGLLALVFAAALGLTAAVIKNSPPLDISQISNLNEPSVLYDDKNNSMDVLVTPQQRTVIPFSSMPQNLKNAFVSIEDQRFYKHKGIDLKRLIGVVFIDIKSKISGNTGIQGASTITQQLVRNIYLSSQISYKRKMQEIYLSLKLEKKLSKTQILEAYMNTIYLGGRALGVEAAAKQYFGKSAKDLNIVEPILVGDKSKIEEISQNIDFDLSGIEIVDEKDGLLEATKLVSDGKADVLMKGLIDTSVIMKQVLDKEIGLRTGKVISHVAVFDVETYHKIFFVTDAAMNINPDLNQKKEIIENAVELAHSLEINNPKVAVIAAKEKVFMKMEATVHAKELADMNERGEITGCIVEGPFALDNAISREAALHKGIGGRVAGDGDILLVPNIDAGNVLYKSFFARAKNAGIILGTKAPIVLTSRADSQEAKLHSIALGALLTSK